MSTETFRFPPLPFPGDIIIAQVMMRAWENPGMRGHDGIYIERGTMMLVLDRWRVDGQVRVRGVVSGTIAVFSHDEEIFDLNWVPLNHLT